MTGGGVDAAPFRIDFPGRDTVLTVAMVLRPDFTCSAVAAVSDGQEVR